MTMKVVYLVNSPKNFLTHRVEVAQGLQQAGWHVEVAGPAGPQTDQIRRAGFPYNDLPMDRRSINPASELRSIVAINRLYGKLKPDLVHHFTIKPVLYGGIAARRNNVSAVVSTITGLGYVYTSNHFKARALRPVIKAGYQLSLGHPNHHVIFQNPDDQARLTTLVSMNGGPAYVVPGAGINSRSISPLSTECRRVPVVALAARMLYDKGVQEFVEAAHLLKENGTKTRCALIGDTDPGNPAAIPRKKLIEWQDTDLVEWWGWQSGMLNLLAEIDIACLPSYREGFPRYLLEAAARGRPIVATNVPGCRAIVRNGENGLLIPPRDPVSLARAITKLVEDSDLRQQMGVAGRRRVEEEFDLKHVLAATIKVYEKALAGE